MAKVTVYDVAAHAGVSAASVSNYFNKPRKLSESTRTRIGQAVASLGFVPNDGAKYLKSGIRPLIGYVSFELAAAHTPRIARAIEHQAAEREHHLLLANDDGSTERELSYIRLFERQRVSGLIVAALGDIEDELAALRRRGIPSVLMGTAATNPEQPSVSNDDAEGGRLAVQHLAKLGRRRVGFVTSSLDVHQLQDRLRGALSAVQALPDVSLEVIPVHERSVGAGIACAEAILDRPVEDRPDALFCVNDLLAIGAVQTLVAQSVRVPEDIAVVGYDDIEFAKSTIVPITTIHTPDYDLGVAAADLLFNEIDRIADVAGITEGPKNIVFKPELVARASSIGRVSAERSLLMS